VLTAGVITGWLLIIAGHAAPGTSRANAELDAVRTGLAAGGGAGAAVALMLAFRRQYHQEIATQNTDFDATERRITELYAKAVEQLGDDKAPVRLGGLYALERLAQDNDAQRQTIVNVICAYLRMPFPATPGAVAASPSGAQGSGADADIMAPPPMEDDTWRQERQVRLTAQRVLFEHLCWSMDLLDDLYGTRPARSWPGIRLDLTGATLIDFNLTDGKIAEAEFGGATFSGDAKFGLATFSGDAMFDGTTFSGDASFIGTKFSGDASFIGTKFSGDASFIGTKFSGGAKFDGATFNGYVGFGASTFSGQASFNRATFSGQASFGRAHFRSLTLFREATFSGDAEFDGATFLGAGFAGATFSGDALFGRATFSGNAGFAGATFNGDALFGRATFSSEALFGGATFDGDAKFDAIICDEGPNAFSFLDAVIKAPSLNHVWPDGWQLQKDRTGKSAVVRVDSRLAPDPK
jgi:uncharacterized protein YjbI with pentapeptide repeats